MEKIVKFVKKEKLLFVIIGLLLASRLLIVLNSSFTFYSDDAIYANLARFLTQGKFEKVFHPFWQPLFPTLSTIIYLFTHNWEIALRVVSVLAGTALSIPIFFLVRQILSALHAILLTLFITFTQPIINASLVPLSDMLAALFITSSITLVFIGLARRENNLLILSSLTLGLTFLTRQEGIMFFGLTLIFFLLYFPVKIFQRKVTMEQITNTLFSFVIIFAIVSSPYIVAMSTKFNELTLSQKFSAQIQQEHAFKIRDNGTTWAQEVWSVKSPNYQSPYFENALPYISKNIFWLWDWFYKKIDGWQQNFLSNFPAWSIPFMLIGVLSLLKKQEYLWSTAYLIFITATAITITIFSTALADIRYLLWVIPFLLYLFYSGIKTIIEIIFHQFLHLKLQSQRFEFGILTVVLLLLPSFSANTIFNPLEYANSFTKNYYRKEILKASEWLNDNTKEPNPRIMMRHEGIEFYTNGETIYLPQELSLNETLSYAKKNKADYLVAWVEELSTEESLSLLNPELKTPGLQRVYQYPEKNPNIIIYSFIN